MAYCIDKISILFYFNRITYVNSTFFYNAHVQYIYYIDTMQLIRIKKKN